jgi:hypothetical protein
MYAPVQTQPAPFDGTGTGQFHDAQTSVPIRQINIIAHGLDIVAVATSVIAGHRVLMVQIDDLNPFYIRCHKDVGAANGDVGDKP